MAIGRKYVAIYRNIFNQVWEMTLGQCQVDWEAYKGVRLCCMFLLREIGKYNDAKEAGETQIESRGIVAPKLVINEFALELLETCHDYRLVPPLELFEVMKLQLDSDYDGLTLYGTENEEKRFRLFEMKNNNPELSDRALAKKLGVDKRTIKRWETEPYRGKGDEDISDFVDDYRLIQNSMNIHEFFPMKYRKDYRKIIKENKGKERGAP